MAKKPATAAPKPAAKAKASSGGAKSARDSPRPTKAASKKPPK